MVDEENNGKDSDFENVAKMFRSRVENELKGNGFDEDEGKVVDTRSYEEFRDQYMPKNLNMYEKLCQFAEKTMPLKPDPKTEPKLQDAINTCQLNTTPTGVYSAALLLPLIMVFGSIVIFFLFPLLLGGTGNMFFVMFFLFGALGVFMVMQKLPFVLANSWRMKASNQMVLAIFYVVTYMRHTSNLELAINFAAEHLNPPLSLDMRKVVWDVETQKYDSVKDSLTAYLESWRKFNPEFVESMHLIQSSLFESSNDRRLNSLDKSLDVMLSETFEKMLHYAHNLKSPLVSLNMLGVVLPILTLVILPLVVSFMDGFRWWHLFAMYDILLPVMVFYLGKKILSTRPGGTGGVDDSEKNPELKKLKKVSFKFGKQELFVNPAFFALTVFIVLFVIGLIPLIWHAFGLVDYGLVMNDNGALTPMPLFDGYEEQYGAPAKYVFLDYRDRTDPVTHAPTGQKVGPYGLGAMLFSLLIPLAFGLSLGLYFKLKSKKLIEVRNRSKALELEFSSALFQLGNRIGDGIPAEMAFGRVASEMEDSLSGKFFSLVNANITRLGMSVEKAIFDPEKGALQYFPSDLIESSMKVLVESSKKGPMVASQALINVSEYIKQMHRVDERLNDLMGDTISSMKGQTTFLTPVISGIVVGITSMITNILGKLSSSMDKFSGAGAGAAGGMGGAGALMGMFGVGIPTYQFQIVVGLYVVELSYILTVIANGIANGVDKVGEEDALGKTMLKSVRLYVVLASIIIVIFNIVAASIGNT